ncbi:MAG TPA: acyloxyacyl hydrolase [Methylomirabilota bacterium]|jgi:opacity protein-like surface antigen|nr:acyloxyacyl hydrolase [Methylomirabilota bacterium]
MTRRFALGLILLVLAMATSPVDAAAFDAEQEFAQGTKAFGVSFGGGVQNNYEGHRTISDISFVNFNPRLSYFFFEPFGPSILRGAFETGLEGWFQYYLSPESATAEGLKLAFRYHLLGLSVGPFVPYLEGTAGAAGTSLKVMEIDSPFTFVLEAGIGLSYFITPGLAVNVGYRFQHISNGHLYQKNRGFNSDSGIVGLTWYFK